MKFFYFYLLLLFIALSSCNSAYFTTANNMRNMYGTVYTTNGKILDGEISVNNNGGFNSREYIRFKAKGQKEEKIPFDEIKELSVRNEFYAPKKLDQGGNLFGNTNRLLLIKRLTKGDSRIQLYEHREINTNTNRDANGNTFTNERTNLQYYISLPNMDKYETYNIERRNVVPDFEDKVSAMVKDCTSLAAKIKAKDKGYFYAQISLRDNKKVETWLRIIEEYNACK
jgi:hypothetical protein